MEKGLAGKTIVLAASRKTDEMTTLIEKQGGTALVRSMQGTVFLAEKEVEPVLKQIVEEKPDFFIFTTGIGTQTLLDVASRLGIYDDFLSVIQNASVASRGYKTFGVLKKLGIQPVAVDEDGTTAGLIQSLKHIDLQGKRVAVQLHGDASPKMIGFLEGKGASILQVLPYQHTAPDDVIVETLIQEMKEKKVDAVCFTTAIQVRSLFKYAKKIGTDKELLSLFTNEIDAVSVGKVTSEALREEGVEHYVAPELERMGAMIIELSKYYNLQSE
ncbi:uroporphyrinogen-III synthase [Alkalihalobacterium bogoriense]|uniref:uroporphyrinogen-III synthase n=1 Tax=Alkalihalobacterium bogoriense TaxID=246272 RepID=UPI00047C7B6B|nr:uroporphyrinogen-III synthase [Alkalihalobacterium bogoriense]